jgi:hypothetical protein
MTHTIFFLFGRLLVIYPHFHISHTPIKYDYNYCSGHPPEAEFLAKIKAIKGVSQVETQTITNVEI